MVPATTSIILLLLFYGGNVSSDTDSVPITEDVLKPGMCPVFRFQDICHLLPPEPLCFEDKDCPDDRKCCEHSCGRIMCSIPIPRVKPGMCPKFCLSESCPKQLPPPECSADDRCPGGEKCCKDPCGAVKCTEPITKEKPWKCLPEIVACEFPAPPPECYNDQWCPGDQKCCTYFCKRQCLNLEQMVE